MQLIITLNKIKEHDPCTDGWKTLLKSLNKTQADDEEFDLMYILESNGIEDAVWCLRCFDYLDICLFAADVAESVLHIYESKYESLAPRQAIQGIRDYEAGKITKHELEILRAASAAADHSDRAAAYAAAYAAGRAADAAYSAADAAAYAAGRASDAAYAAHAAAHAAAYAAAVEWDVIEELFIKHFGDD